MVYYRNYHVERLHDQEQNVRGLMDRLTSQIEQPAEYVGQMAAYQVGDRFLGRRVAEPTDRLDGANANAGRLVLLQAVHRRLEVPRAHLRRHYLSVSSAEAQAATE